MKVLFLLLQFPKLSETFILNQITGLIDRGVDVSILANRINRDELINAGVDDYRLLENHTKYYYQGNTLFKNINHTANNIIRVNPKYYKYILNSFKFKSVKYTNLVSAYARFSKDFDIIHAHFGYNSFPGVVLKNSGIFNGKLITSFHGNDLGKYIRNNNPYRELINEGDLFLPISNFLSKRLLKLGFPEEKIQVHKVGVNVENYKYKKREKRDKIKLLSVGRLIEKKGFDIAIKAMDILINEIKFNDIEYNIIGSGPLEKDLEVTVNKYNLNKNINFCGEKIHSEVMDYMYDSDILVTPSYEAVNGDIEGIPTVLMEAMSTGLPVISTFHSGIPELVETNINGMLCNVKDHEELAGKIKVLKNDQVRRNTLALNARNSVEIMHDINKLNDNLLKIYENVLIK